MASTSMALDDAISRCRRARVTGLLRVVGPEDEEAEIRFRSGEPERVRCGQSEGDEALARISSIPNPSFEAVPSLPPLSRCSQQEFPREGCLSAERRPLELFIYCGERALTCCLHLECANRQVLATYEQGSLMSIEPAADMTLRVLEATEGSYLFSLPRPALSDLKAPGVPDLGELGAATAAGSPSKRREGAAARRPPGRLSPRQITLAGGALVILALGGSVVYAMDRAASAGPCSDCR